MKFYKVAFVGALVLLAACESDPNAPRYSSTYVDINGDSSGLRSSEAQYMCEGRAKQAHLAAEAAAKSRYSRTETTCERSYYDDKIVCKDAEAGGGGFSGGMAIARAGNDAEAREMAICMSDYGFIKRQVCVANC